MLLMWSLGCFIYNTGFLALSPSYYYYYFKQGNPRQMLLPASHWSRQQCLWWCRLFLLLTHFCLYWNSVMTLNLKAKQITFWLTYFPLGNVGSIHANPLQPGLSAGFILPLAPGWLWTVSILGTVSYCFLSLLFSFSKNQIPLVLRTNAFPPRTISRASHSIPKNSNNLEAQSVSRLSLSRITEEGSWW